MNEIQRDRLARRVFSSPEGKEWLSLVENESPAMAFMVAQIRAAIARDNARLHANQPPYTVDGRVLTWSNRPFSDG